MWFVLLILIYILRIILFLPFIVSPPFLLYNRKYRVSLLEVITIQASFQASMSCCKRMILNTWTKCLWISGFRIAERGQRSLEQVRGHGLHLGDGQLGTISQCLVIMILPHLPETLSWVISTVICPLHIEGQ